ncbi:MAG: prephenate dehydrogenase [Christensenellales bacterium]|jgi:prephenate dehydrogenase
MFTTVIVGLGLMGGSFAMAAQGFKGGRICAIDTDKQVMAAALKSGVIESGSSSPDIISKADLAILCLNPADTISFIQRNAALFKPGSLVTDISGVKRAIHPAIALLPPEVEYVGSHPMAGRECSGFKNAQKDLFKGANYIITPENASDKSVSLIRELAAYIGCSNIITSTAETHDRNIAYTSQLMHVLAAAICFDSDLKASIGFDGNSFRDCTRVAKLDPLMWSSLFALNADYLSSSVKKLEDSLGYLRLLIEGRNTKDIEQALLKAVKLKEEWQNAKDSR